VQSLYSLGDRVNRVRVVLDSGERREAVRAAFSARLPETLVVQSPVAQLELAGGILRSTELALSFAGALSLAMAAFIVLNTLRMNFGERRRDMAVLRVLGVTTGQLVGLQLVEGLLLGLIGALLGIPLGLALGAGLASLMQQLVEAEIPAPELPYWTLAAALVVGPLVAGVAALVPALQSRGISPVEALGDVEARRGERFPWWSVLGGAAVWSVAVVLLLLVWLERLSTEAAIPAGVLMLVGFIAVIPALLRPVIRVLERMLAPWLKMEGDFAAQQLLHRATRTGLTVGVLVVAISSGVGMGNAIINNVDDVRGWYRRMTAGDIMLSGPSADEVSEVSRDDADIGKLVTGLPGVDFVVESRYLPARAAGVPTVCIVHDFAPQLELPWAVTHEEDQQLREGLKAGQAVIGSALAKRLGLTVGDTLRLQLQGRELSLPIAGAVSDYTAGGMAVFVDQRPAAELITLGRPQIFTVATQPGTAIEPLVEELKPLVEGEGLSVQSFAEIRGGLDTLIAGIVGALWGLLAIGFVIGGLAVANTLSMSVFEQTRELGLLRVIGMTRPQMRKMIFCESLLLGILGTLLGTLAGLTTAWIIHLCNEPLLGHAIPFTLHTWLLVANAVACLGITLFAAWLPGERAARLDFLSAIAYE
jgi:putative ABC transport system permease protein